MRRSPLSLVLVLLLLGASVQGCFGSDKGGGLSSSDLDISPEPLTAGTFQSVHFHADKAMRVLIPYLVLQPDTGYVQNGTILDLGDDQEDEITILIPPRADEFAVLIGKPGQSVFPIREGNVSWETWSDQGMKATRGVEVVDPEHEGGLPELLNSTAPGGSVIISADYPETQRVLEEAGFTTTSVDMAHIRAADGSLTCCSIFYG